MSSGDIPPNDDPSPEEVLEALQEAIINNPRLADMPVEEIARQLVLEAHLHQEPPLALVEVALDNIISHYTSWKMDQKRTRNSIHATLAVYLRIR